MKFSFSQAFAPLSISLSPNTEPDDVLLAFRLLFQPWRWREGRGIQQVEKAFAEKLGISYAISFNSGRSAFLAVLSSLKPDFEGAQKSGFGENEILLQAFTCNAVPNPILWSGLKPVYVDCGQDYNMAAQDLAKKITPRSRAVVVQHTFGIPAAMDRIGEVCRKHNLLLIEDCAHALGAEYGGRQVGTMGDVSFFSFSRDKVISSVYGGMVATNNGELAERLRSYQETAGQPSLWWVFQELLHPVVLNWKILPLYGVGGKYILIIAQWLHLLSKAVHWKEKRGEKPGYFPKQLPNALALLALKQLGKLDRFNAHRKKLAEYYREALSVPRSTFQVPSSKGGAIFLRLPVQHPQAHEIIARAWSKNLLIGDWYMSPVAPPDTDIAKMGYEWGSCPVAEQFAKTTFNLPTHIRISKKDAATIISFLKSA